jgi:hypothetical protein
MKNNKIDLVLNIKRNIMYQKGQTVITPHGKAIITVVDTIGKAVRVEHLEARTPITDYMFSDLKFEIEQKI